MGSDKTSIDMKKTGERLKSLCAKKGVTVKCIQEELHIGAFQSVYSWFAGKSLPSLDNMYRLSKLLNVPMENMIVDNSKPIIVDLKRWWGREQRYLLVYHNNLKESDL